MRVQRYYFFLNYQIFQRLFFKKMRILSVFKAKYAFFIVLSAKNELLRSFFYQSNPFGSDNLHIHIPAGFPNFHPNARFL